MNYKKSMEVLKDVPLNDKQIIWCEEASEFIKSISKWARKKELTTEIRDDIIDSMVDLAICIEDLSIQIDLKNEEFDSMYEKKMLKNAKTFGEK